MDKIKISELTAATSGTTTDVGVIVQSGTTYKQTRDVLQLRGHYDHTLSGDLTISYATYVQSLHYIDTGGADRAVTLDTDYPAGFELTVIMIGTELLSINPLTINSGLTYGRKETFYFDGTSWW